MQRYAVLPGLFAQSLKSDVDVCVGADGCEKRTIRKHVGGVENMSRAAGGVMGIVPIDEGYAVEAWATSHNGKT